MKINSAEMELLRWVSVCTALAREVQKYEAN